MSGTGSLLQAGDDGDGSVAFFYSDHPPQLEPPDRAGARGA